MADQREQIGQQLRALYRASTHSQLRLLLEQQEAGDLSRHLRYSEYLVAARKEKMQVYLDTALRLDAISQEIAAAIAELKTTQATLEQEHANLVTQRESRQQLAAAADAELSSKGTALNQLEQDRTALQKVIERIEKQRALAKAQEEQRQREQALREQREQAAREQAARDLEEKQRLATQQKQDQPAQQSAPRTTATTASPELAVSQPATAAKPAEPAYSAEDLARLQSQSFTQRKGSMPWPVRGKLANRYGDNRQGSVKWDGIRVQAPAGSEVRAIHGGRVMYAEWLRGQGMLLVLDHGDGYMSLYAHNDALLREPGEWVKPGDPIAQVGNSGGEKEPGLYFEIRQNGQTVNPLLWLGKH